MSEMVREREKQTKIQNYVHCDTIFKISENFIIDKFALISEIVRNALFLCTGTKTGLQKQNISGDLQLNF